MKCVIRVNALRMRERESVCVRGVSNGLMYTLDYYTNIALSVYVLSLFDVLLYNITPSTSTVMRL